MYQTYSILQKLWLFIKLFTPMCITQFSLIGGYIYSHLLTGQYSTIDLAGVATGYNLWLLFYIFAQGTLLVSHQLFLSYWELRKPMIFQQSFIKVFISVQA